MTARIGTPHRIGAEEYRGAPTMTTSPGRVAQRESARLTRERSLVRTQPRPLEEPLLRQGFVVPVLSPDFGCEDAESRFVPNRAQSMPSTRALRAAFSSSPRRMAWA